MYIWILLLNALSSVGRLTDVAAELVPTPYVQSHIQSVRHEKICFQYDNMHLIFLIPLIVSEKYFQ